MNLYAQGKQTKSQKGFTLIEIMVVLFIIGLMAAVVAPALFDNTEEARLKKAAIDIQQLEGALQRYNLRTNAFPTTEQGLQALVSAPTTGDIPRSYPEGGFITRLPKDPWDNDYVLLYPGEVGRYDLYSLGPDGQEGTDDDIGTWNLNDYL